MGSITAGINQPPHPPANTTGLDAIHGGGIGNVAKLDGSVEKVSNAGLRELLALGDDQGNLRISLPVPDALSILCSHQRRPSQDAGIGLVGVGLASQQVQCIPKLTVGGSVQACGLPA